MKAVVAAFNQEKALVGAFSVITNLRMELFQALILLHQISSPASSQQQPWCLHGIRFWSVTVVDIKSILSQFFLHEKLNHCCCIGIVGSAILIPIIKICIDRFQMTTKSHFHGSGFWICKNEQQLWWQISEPYLTFFSTLSTIFYFCSNDET